MWFLYFSSILQRCLCSFTSFHRVWRDVRGLVGCGTLRANPCCSVVFRQVLQDLRRGCSDSCAITCCSGLAQRFQHCLQPWEIAVREAAVTAGANQGVAAAGSLLSITATNQQKGWDAAVRILKCLISLFELGPYILTELCTLPSIWEDNAGICLKSLETASLEGWNAGSGSSHFLGGGLPCSKLKRQKLNLIFLLF